MKAAVYDKYGPPEVLYIKEVNKPIPKENEVLVKVFTSAVTAADYRLRAAKFPPGFGFLARLVFGIFKPRKNILGNSFSGVVESVGSKVTSFNVGDEVFGMTVKLGAYAQYLTILENKLIVKKPKNLSHEEASGLVFGGTTALFFLRDKAKIKKGQKVLINGASGAVGTNAVQLAKYYKTEVTGVCSTDNVKLVSSLGADKIIDYKRENIFSRKEKYDIVLDTVGNINAKNGLQLLSENGVLVLIVSSLKDMLRLNKKVLTGVAPERKEDLNLLIELYNNNQIKVVIDKTYNFEDIVKAHQHTDTGHKKGNIILKIK